MTELQETGRGPGGAANTQYDWMDKEVAAEILRHVQAMIVAQNTSADGVNAKLTMALSQAVQLATIALGAATLPLAEKAWMPVWAGIALTAAGICAAGAALPAWQGLRVRKWVAPGLSLKKTAFPSVLKATPQTAMMLMAGAYEEGISANQKTADDLDRFLNRTRTLLAITPLVGLAMAAIAWWLLGNQ